MISQLDKYGDDFLSTVPRMSLIWYMAKKRPHTMVVNLDKSSKNLHETCQAIKDKSYVSFEYASKLIVIPSKSDSMSSFDIPGLNNDALL